MSTPTLTCQYSNDTHAACRSFEQVPRWFRADKDPPRRWCTCGRCFFKFFHPKSCYPLSTAAALTQPVQLEVHYIHHHAFVWIINRHLTYHWHLSALSAPFAIIKLIIDTFNIFCKSIIHQYYILFPQANTHQSSSQTVIIHFPVDDINSESFHGYWSWWAIIESWLFTNHSKPILHGVHPKIEWCITIND